MEDLCSPEKPADKPYDVLVKIVKNHLEPEPSIIAERLKYRQRVQIRGETVAEYDAALKNLAKKWDFKEQLEENLRDQFVAGLCSEIVKQRLFSEKCLNYSRAYEIARNMEAAEKNISGPESNHSVNKLNHREHGHFHSMESRASSSQERSNNRKCFPSSSTRRQQQSSREFQCTVCDVGETAKDGLSSGIETVKETMQSAVDTTEHGVETVIGKIGETFNFTSGTDLKDDLEEKKDELVTNASDAAAEAVSEAETVLASETESAKEAFTSKTSPVFETVNSTAEDMENAAEEIKENGIELIDDLEEHVDDVLGDSVDNLEKRAQEMLSSSPHGSPVKELKKEESPLTFWEAAADAVLLQKTIKSFEHARDYRRDNDDKKFFHNSEIYGVNEISELKTDNNTNIKREVITD